MKAKNRMAVLLTLIGIGASTLAPLVHAADALAVRVDTLLRTSASWDGTPYAAYPAGTPELSLVKITIPPHSALPWHTHAMPNVAYVVSGELLVEKQDSDQQKRLVKGDVLPEMVARVHRGVTGNEPVELLVFYAGARGMPLSHTAHAN